MLLLLNLPNTPKINVLFNSECSDITDVLLKNVAKL